MTERTLVVILAQTRAATLTWEGFRRNVLEELGADLAVCISRGAGNDERNPFWRAAKHRWVSEEYEDFADGFDVAQRAICGEGPAPDWRILTGIKEHWLGGVKQHGAGKGAGGIMIYFRWFLLHNLRKSGVIDQYDRFIITRSDFMWPVPHPPLSVLDLADVWVPNGEHWGGITDRHLVVSRADLEAALSLMEPIVTRPQELAHYMQCKSDWNIERFQAFHFMSNGLLARTRGFPYVMFLVRGPGDPTSWSQGEYHRKLGLFIKYRGELASTERWAPALQAREHWERLHQAGELPLGHIMPQGQS